MDECRDLEPLKEYAAGLVALIITKKERENKAPLLATMTEMESQLSADFRTVLNELCREKVLTFHKDLNGRLMFEFTPPK